MHNMILFIKISIGQTTFCRAGICDVLLYGGFRRTFQSHRQQGLICWRVTSLEVGDNRVKSRSVVFLDTVTQGLLDTVKLILTVAGQTVKFSKMKRQLKLFKIIPIA